MLLSRNRRCSRDTEGSWRRDSLRSVGVVDAVYSRSRVPRGGVRAFGFRGEDLFFFSLGVVIIATAVPFRRAGGGAWERVLIRSRGK